MRGEESIHVAHVVCSAAFAGVERYISMLAPALVERGIDVSVVGGAEDMRQAASVHGFHHVPAVSVRDAAKALRRLPKKPDILNTHMSDADLAGVLHAARPGVRARLVSTRHFAAPRGGRPVVRRAFALMDNRFAAQIAISEFVAASIGGASTVIHTGVEDADVSARGARKKVVLMAQRLEAEKGCMLAVETWARTSARQDGWTLRIAGEGAERPEMERLAARLGVGESIEFLGYRSDVGELMAESAMLFAPTPREGLGLSVVEAMARATPVVASASGGHAESVGRVPDAAVFAPGDAAAAAALIDGLAGDEPRRVEYGELLQNRQRSEFSVEAQIDRTIALYEKVLQK